MRLHWRRALDVNRAREAFGFEATMPFEEGLGLTVNAYLAALRCRPIAGGETVYGNLPSGDPATAT